MEISEIRIFLKESPDKKLKAYATVTFDNAFVVRNIKVIQGSAGLFIAMPSRKIKVSCPKCGGKNEVGIKYCGSCGSLLAVHEPVSSQVHDAKADHRDIAHPVTQEFRDYLQNKVLETYQAEVQAKK